MRQKLTIQTGVEGFYDITRPVLEVVRASAVSDGSCLIYCPHTTAAITINENADPDVIRDLLYGLQQAYPDRPQFRHSEGNSAAHLKASVIGSSVTVPIANHGLLLGTWQGIYFCEFDGPRTRNYFVQIV